MDSALPLVAIVGRPNVGKSTLFNRLVGSRRAIVTDEPGVTRDRLYGVASRAGFRLVDTGGLTPSDAEVLARDIGRQAGVALAEASLVLLVVDARAGLTPLDEEIAAMLRRAERETLVVANKAETEALGAGAAAEFSRLGFGEPLPVSAEHGEGIGALLAAVEARLPSAPEGAAATEGETGAIAVALVGRPNVGKSSLLNRIVGEDRVLVSEIPGTTRDTIDTLLVRHGTRFRLLDTAGIRRRAKWSRSAERLAALAAARAVERADVAILVLDAGESLAAQDAHIAGIVRDAARPMIVAVNKWDAEADREVRAKSWEAEVRQRLRFAKETPVLFVSARTGQRVERLLDRVVEVHAAAGIRVPTPALNRWLQEAAERERTAPAGGKSVRLFYAAQTGIHPPRFLFFCNDPRRVHFSLRRRLENSLREAFGFGAAPIRLAFRSRRERKAS